MQKLYTSPRANLKGHTKPDIQPYRAKLNPIFTSPTYCAHEHYYSLRNLILKFPFARCKQRKRDEYPLHEDRFRNLPCRQNQKPECAEVARGPCGPHPRDAQCQHGIDIPQSSARRQWQSSRRRRGAPFDPAQTAAQERRPCHRIAPYRFPGIPPSPTFVFLMKNRRFKPSRSHSFV